MFQQVTGEREEDREQARGEGWGDKERSDKEGEKNAIWCRNGKKDGLSGSSGPQTLLIL